MSRDQFTEEVARRLAPFEIIVTMDLDVCASAYMLQARKVYRGVEVAQNIHFSSFYRFDAEDAGWVSRDLLWNLQDELAKPRYEASGKHKVYDRNQGRNLSAKEVAELLNTKATEGKTHVYPRFR